MVNKKKDDCSERCGLKSESGHLNEMFNVENYTEINNQIMDTIKRNTIETTKKEDDETRHSFGLNIQGAVLEIVKDKTEEERGLILTGFLLEKRLNSLENLMKEEYVKQKIQELIGKGNFDIFKG